MTEPDDEPPPPRRPAPSTNDWQDDAEPPPPRPKRPPPTHPADLPCVDPECRGSRPTGPVLCQHCSARIERAHRDHRLRYQNRSLSGVPDHDDYHERTP